MEKFKFPFVEHAAFRRISATPATAGEALDAGIKISVKSEKETLGYVVKEPIGKDLELTYWMPAFAFEGSHIRTDKYTIGEALLLLMDGAILRRTFWPGNEMIRWEKESVDAEGFIHGGHITKIHIYPDPVKDDKSDIVLEAWVPTQEDLFAKDFQTVSIDFDKVKKGA